MNEKPIIVANWKLGLDFDQSTVLARQIANDAQELTSHAHLILCPTATAIQQVIAEFPEPKPVSFGIQNVYSELSGSFTGENSAASAQQLGCRYVLLGHSERRRHFGETDDGVAKKTKLALELGLIPIVCVGETYEERQSGQAELVVTKQVKEALASAPIHENTQILLAYEPIWAIGTGQAIHPEQANMMGLVIHQQLVDMFSEQILKNIILLYGGSIDASNIQGFVDGRVLRGVLVGGASQNFDDFRALVLTLANK